MASRQRFDVGGAPLGPSSKHLRDGRATVPCAEAGLDVVVVDREDPDATVAESFDGRASAIAFGSRQALAAIGLWAKVAAEAAPILEIRVADDNAPLFLHYDHREVGDQPLGWIVENRVLRRALLARVRELPRLRHLAPSTVVDVERSSMGAVVRPQRARALPPGLGQDGSSTGVFGQHFGASGVPIGPEFQVNTHTNGAQNNPSIGATPGGDFVVVWESGGYPPQDGSNDGVYLISCS
jgi:hypothetical protein